MAACLNGIAAHGGLRPFGSTFLVFSDYMKPAIRLAAIMRLPDASHDVRSSEPRVKPEGIPAIRNRAWIAVTAFTGVMWTNQVLLHTVIPVWLVTETDAPQVLVAILFGTNTVMCIVLPRLASRGIRLVDCPVSGGVGRAKTGELAIMAGGAEADLD